MSKRRLIDLAKAIYVLFSANCFDFSITYVVILDMCLLKSDWKQMFLYKWPCYGHFWPFFSHLYVHLSQNWGLDGHFEVFNRSKFKIYGLRCNLRPKASSASYQKIATDKRPFYDHIWPFFCQPHGYLSQNWDSDSHFEVLNEFKY